MVTRDDDEERIITEAATQDQTILQSIADLAALQQTANHVELKNEIQKLRGELIKTIKGHTEDIKRLHKDVKDIKDLMQIKNEQHMRNYSIHPSGYKLPETTL